MCEHQMEKKNDSMHQASTTKRKKNLFISYNTQSRLHEEYWNIRALVHFAGLKSKDPFLHYLK